MSGLKRFFALGREISIFKFTIDTRNIVAGATNGSENPLTFRIPHGISNINNSAIVKVSDGRPDIIISSATPSTILNFSTAGIYEVTIIGKLTFGFSLINVGYDREKITHIDNWGHEIIFQARSFENCINLIIRAENTLVLLPESSNFFRNIKGFQTSLELFDTSKVTSIGGMISGVMTPLPSFFNPFWQSLVNMTGLYGSNTMLPNVNKIEIISDSLTTVFRPFDNMTFQNTGPIELIMKTPNLTSITQLFRNGQVPIRCHAGGVDVRNVTDATNWKTSVAFTNAQVDATLIGWAKLPFMQPGVSWVFGSTSKYSNNPEVIAAYNKLTQEWGVLFPGLVMA